MPLMLLKSWNIIVTIEVGKTLSVCAVGEFINHLFDPGSA